MPETEHLPEGWEKRTSRSTGKDKPKLKTPAKLHLQPVIFRFSIRKYVCALQV